MDGLEPFASFYWVARDLLGTRGWTFARGVSDADLDAWQERLTFTFPPELRRMLQMGFPVDAPKRERRDFSVPARVSKLVSGKVAIQVGARVIYLPERLGTKRPIVERSWLHTSLIDWHNTSSEGVARVHGLMWDHQRDILKMMVLHGGDWPIEWGARPSRWWIADEAGVRPEDPDDIAEIVRARLPEMPPLVPLDSRTFLPSTEVPGMPVYQYRYGQDLQLHAFDLTGALARWSGLMPSSPRGEMRVAPAWGGFWSQFASINATDTDPSVVKRQHEALVAYCLGSEHPESVYRSFHHLYGQGEGDPDADPETGDTRWLIRVEAAGMGGPPAPGRFFGPSPDPEDRLIVSDEDRKERGGGSHPHHNP